MRETLPKRQGFLLFAALCAADDGSILLDCPGLVTGG